MTYKLAGLSRSTIGGFVAGITEHVALARTRTAEAEKFADEISALEEQKEAAETAARESIEIAREVAELVAERFRKTERYIVDPQDEGDGSPPYFEVYDLFGEETLNAPYEQATAEAQLQALRAIRASDVYEPHHFEQADWWLSDNAASYFPRSS